MVFVCVLVITVLVLSLAHTVLVLCLNTNTVQGTLPRLIVSVLTRDIATEILSVCPSVYLSVRDVLVLDENGLTCCHSFFTIH